MFFARASFAASDTRTVDLLGKVDQDTGAIFNDLTLGASYQFSQDDATPALIAFADATVVEAADADGDDYAYARTFNAGLTTYRVIDPIVLILTGGYRAAIGRGVGGADIDPGDVLYLNPGLAFAVNDTITLTGGMGIRHRLADEVDGKDVGTRYTRAELEFGLGYSLGDDLTLRATTRSDVVGEGGFTADLSASYAFGG